VIQKAMKKIFKRRRKRERGILLKKCHLFLLKSYCLNWRVEWNITLLLTNLS